MEILPAQLEQLLVEVDEGPHDVDGLRPLRRLEVVVWRHGAVPRLHAVQNVRGEQGGQIVGVHLVPREVLAARAPSVLAVLRDEMEEVQEDVHRVSIDLEMRNVHSEDDLDDNNDVPEVRAGSHDAWHLSAACDCGFLQKYVR